MNKCKKQVEQEVWLYYGERQTVLSPAGISCVSLVRINWMFQGAKFFLMPSGMTVH